MVFIFLLFGNQRYEIVKQIKSTDADNKRLNIESVVIIIRDIFRKKRQKSDSKKHKGALDKKRMSKEKIVTAEKGEKYREKRR